MMETVLLACAVETEALAIRETLRVDFDVIQFPTDALLMAYLTENPDQSDVIILDSTINPNGMVACVESVRRKSPMVEIILLMDRDHAHKMVDSVKAGVTEIITKPYYHSILLLAVRHSFEQSTLVAHLHRQLARVSDESIHRRMDAFREFLMRRLHHHQSVTPSEIQLFFPGPRRHLCRWINYLKYSNPTH
jgi:DNA-binding NtrC family response regulator